MKIAITGATGFLGRYLVAQLAAEQHACRCWCRPNSNRSGLEHVAAHVTWVEGKLGDWDACRELVGGCDALVHAALERPAGSHFLGREFDAEMAMRNIAGSLQLFEAARAAGVKRIVYISSCAVYAKILEDRPLDETHPMWPNSHYGAHKAAVEAFVHSYAQAENYPICALRPTGIYGIDHPLDASKWYELIAGVVRGETVECRGGGKEVHAADVAKAASLLLQVEEERMAGQSFNCCDQYISQFDVATLAQGLAGSRAQIVGEPTQPKHQIDTAKLRKLGMEFGGRPKLDKTIREMIGAIRITGNTVV